MEQSEPAAKRPRVEPAEAFPPVCEADVGISVYATAGVDGFHGVIKERYTDFLVNEIDETGQVVHLTSFAVPPSAAPAIDKDKSESDLRAVIGEERVAALTELLASSDRKATLEISNVTDKAARTLVHTSIRALFPGLVSDTQGDVIRVSRAKGRHQNNAPRGSWAGGDKSYCEAVLHKSNMDTTECLSRLAGILHVNTSCFSIAGTKDKRGVTTQRIRFFKISADRLAGLNASLRGMQLGNFSYVANPLRLGMLSGNEFGIVLRDVKADTAHVDSAMEALRQRGFVNYFGMQRFGTGSIRTHLVGSAVLRGDFARAVQLILSPRPGETDSTAACKAYAEGAEPAAVLAMMPRRCAVERLLLQNLLRLGKTNYTDAFGTLPRPTRLLYAHSFQSLIWNELVSLRLSRDGFRAVPGDLVLAESAPGDDAPPLEDAVVALAADGTVAESAAADSVLDDRRLATVEVLTEDTAAGRTIFDIVLPLPGVNVTYPPSLKDDYVRLMAAHGVTQDMLQASRKEYMLHGSYRNIVSRVPGLEWDHLSYDDPTAQLTTSDLERLRNQVPLPPPADGRYRALFLRFKLKASQYATMVLRELLKIDTSSAHQAALTATAKAQQSQ